MSIVRHGVTLEEVDPVPREPNPAADRESGPEERL